MPMTLKKVAQEAGVSYATVSRIINGRPGASLATIDAVHKAVAHVGYSPKPPEERRGPKTSGYRAKTCNIAVLYLGVSMRMALHYPALGDTLYGIESELKKEGFNTIVSYVQDQEDIPQCIVKDNIDGVLLCGRIVENFDVSQIKAPIVWVGQPISPLFLECDIVQEDNAMIGTLAAEYLRGQGHRDVAFVSVNSSSSVFRDRELYFRTTFEKLGGNVITIFEDKKDTALSIRDSHLVNIEPIVEKIIEAKPCVTGVFSAADATTANIYASLSKRNINIIEKFEFISAGFERSLLAGLHPMPAIIDTQNELIGTKAAKQLVWRLSNKDNEEQITVRIKPKIRL
jgi:LacI family transcriptional regulator